MSTLTRDGTTEPVSRDQILRHARGQGNVHFPCSADHEQDWQPYTVDPYSAICDDHTYIHIIVTKTLSSLLQCPSVLSLLYTNNIARSSHHREKLEVGARSQLHAIFVREPLLEISELRPEGRRVHPRNRARLSDGLVRYWYTFRRGGGKVDMTSSMTAATRHQ